jgi:hypothetical protein
MDYFYSGVVFIMVANYSDNDLFYFLACYLIILNVFVLAYLFIRLYMFKRISFLADFGAGLLKKYIYLFLNSWLNT